MHKMLEMEVTLNLMPPTSFALWMTKLKSKEVK